MTSEMLHNAHKIAYLISQYPKHDIGQIIALLQLPAIDINTAIWAAIDLGLISEPDEKKKDAVKLLKAPLVWEFGAKLDELEEMLLYAIAKLNAKQTDLEENYLSNWTAGYPAHDVLIALWQLEDSQELAKYTIEDGENSYTFFTLYANRNKGWGRKQFKRPPEV